MLSTSNVEKLLTELVTGNSLETRMSKHLSSLLIAEQ